jgi:hypothetical protein
MRTPRLYRVALMAYPADYRAARAPEFAATLAEGDEERGGPSLREAAALVGRGIAMRARRLERPDWLLVAAALLPLVAVIGGFTWAERVFADSAILTTGPGWWGFAMGVAAYVVLAVLLFDALASRRRRTIAAVLAAPVGFLAFTAPGNLFNAGIPSIGTILDYAVWSVEATFVNWRHTVPGLLAAVGASWVALEALSRLSSPGRRRALGVVLAALAAIAVAKSLSRPDLPAEYAQSAFADLGAAALLAALSVPLALAALWPARPKPQL